MEELEQFTHLLEKRKNDSDERSLEDKIGNKEKESLIHVDIKNEGFIDDVIYDYNIKKGAIALCAILVIVIPVLISIAGAIFGYAYTFVIGFVFILLGILFSMALLDEGKKCEKELNDYKVASIILQQVKLKDMKKENGKFNFYFLKDDGTLKKIRFISFSFEYVDYLEKNEIMVDLKSKCIFISGKYLLD